MKTMTSTPSQPLPMRGLCAVVAALLFAFSVYELMLHPSADNGTWRGLALSSLYLVMCLTQRRLFAINKRSHQRISPQ